MCKVSSHLVLLALCLTGCAPLQVDLSGSEYQPTSNVSTAPRRVASITIINRAADAELQNHLFSKSLIPIKTAVSPQSTVESDIKLLLAQTLRVGDGTDKSVLVTIRKVDAFWTLGVADRIPIVGLATVASDTEFVMHVVLSLEIRNNGAIVATYPVDHEVKIIGKATTRTVIANSYQRLIAKYRQVVLGDIQHNFIDKTL
jgi:hypothetical protein